MKNLNIATLFFLFLTTAFANELQISKSDFKKRHGAIVRILTKHEASQSYPSKMIQEGELYSSFKIYHLFLSEAYANTNELCFFGGWPSIKLGTKCSTPWKHRQNSSLQKYGARYDQDHYCSRDPMYRNSGIPSEKLFRCNPTLFGSAPSGKGKCIEIENYNNVTKQCHEETQGSIDDIYNKYLSDPAFKENYLSTARDIASFCQNNSAYEACNYLMTSLNELNTKICEAVPEPTLKENIVTQINNLLNKIRPNREPAEVEEPEPTVDPRCQIEGTDAAWKANCVQLLSSDIPSAALDYALKVMKINATSFRTNKCFDSRGLKHSSHPSMMGLTGDRLENNLLANGLRNKCQIVINDTDDRSLSASGDDCRGRMYYIDLCSGSSPTVTEDYFNLGTGTCRGGRHGYTNGSGLHTTVKGAFFTHNETFDFKDVTRQQSHYSRTARDVQRAGGPNEAVAIHLFGLQNTNNLASRTGKYMHVSPHRSSWGCPSIKAENYHMIEALANNGPSLVLNWGREGMEDIETCTE